MRTAAARQSLVRCGAVAAVVAGLLVPTAGCGGDDGDTDPGRLMPALVEQTEVAGGSRDQRADLRRIVEGMDGTTLERVAIGRPPAGEEGGDVALTFAPVPGNTVRRQWDQWVIAGAFSRRLLAAGAPADVQASDGRSTFRAQPRVRGEPDPRPLSRAREQEIVRDVRKAAAASNGGRVRVGVHRPYGVAITVSLSPDDPAAYLKTEFGALLRRLDRYRPRLEGLYVAVLDPERRLALEWGSWTRNPAGSYWVRRDLALCSPIRQSEPRGTDPPPDCPA